MKTINCWKYQGFRCSLTIVIDIRVSGAHKISSDSNNQFSLTNDRGFYVNIYNPP